MATGSWVNQDIYINATFTVNSYFIISNCWLRFGPNGKIIVDGHGAHLQSSGSYYFGCDGWAGIYVDGGSIVSMYADQVEDAQNAVTIASSYAPITLQSCFFNRNIVDIYVVAGVAANALITDNVFDCTSNTFLGSRSSIGIKVNTSATLTFGLPAGPTNVVRNHLRGASITSSTLNVRNGEFACNTVCGIQTTSGRLDLRTDLSFTNYNVFQLNRADIKTDNTNLFVEACQFFHCESDNLVSANNTLARPIDIHHNAFLIDNNNLYAVNHTKSAITIDRSSGALGLTYTNLIELNTVVVDAFTTNEARSAIRATGYPGTYDLMKIATNTVNIAQGGSNPSAMTIRPTTLFDVTVNSAEGFHVLGNHIYPTNIDNANNSNRWGFYVHDWTSPS
ncbi:MAG: hypothetical protein ABIQ93_17180, partial [Saprospiraceae bacterium]